MIPSILEENTYRLETFSAGFDPITGHGSIGERRLLTLPDFIIPQQWLPISMFTTPLIKQLEQVGSIDAYVEKHLQTRFPDTDANTLHAQLTSSLVMLRCRHDFPFWCATFIYIKNKGGGGDTLFRLNNAQRIFISRLEEQRLADKPIRIILLKARQWGGSTVTQIYMAWLQLLHSTGLNSLIIAHQQSASETIKAMFYRMLDRYPGFMLADNNPLYDPTSPKLVGDGRSGLTHRVPSRNCTITIGTAKSPDSSRGGDYNLVHLSEVGLWNDTDGRHPADIVRSACSGVLYRPLTMIVFESTANGVGNFFHKEYLAASNPDAGSQFKSVFIPWFNIEAYSLPITANTLSDLDIPLPTHQSPDSLTAAFAQWLYDNRMRDTTTSDRRAPGNYLWRLWQLGATLQGINWYIAERAKFSSHASMAAEFPSDDVEAFVNSGADVFNTYHVAEFAAACRPPRYIGDVTSPRADTGADALNELQFHPDTQGCLSIWDTPETPQPGDTETITDRYLTVVDIGGRSADADWSVIVVFDRIRLIDGERPAVVAQWYGHIDIDILAWKAAQIAAFYDNSLLVIESNTLETHDPYRSVEGDQSHFVLNQIADIYPNLYARRPSEDDIRNQRPRKYGFHTNTATKPMIISNLVKCVRDHLYTERDSRVLDEYRSYERKPNGAYGARPGCHDDLLMTRAIGLHICFNEMPLPLIKKINHTPSSSFISKPLSAASF